MMNRYRTWLGVIVGCLGVVGCASDSDVAIEGASSSVSDVVAGLQGGDGSLVCARLHADGQVALADSKGSESCVEAVAQGGFDQELIDSASRLDSYSMELNGGVLALSGSGAQGLASLLGVEDLWMSEFQGDWMIHTTDQLPDGSNS